MVPKMLLDSIFGDLTFNILKLIINEANSNYDTSF